MCINMYKYIEGTHLSGVDFPIPVAPGGVGVRFPLNGAVNVGSDPFLLTYGHGLGPAEPPNFQTTNKFSSSPRRKRSLMAQTFPVHHLFIMRDGYFDE